MRGREVRREGSRLHRLLPADADDRMVEPDLQPDVPEQRAVRVRLHVGLGLLGLGPDAEKLEERRHGPPAQ